MARLLVLAVVGLAAAPLPALAGSATSQSIWNMGHALGQAKSQVPNGAKVTGTNCNEIYVADDLPGTFFSTIQVFMHSHEE